MAATIPHPDPPAGLSPLAVERTSRIIREQGGRADALIEVLHRVQEIHGYLPKPALAQVARELQLPLARVYGVASFYHLFRLKAPSQHRCAVCLGTACFVKGGADLAALLERRLGVRLDGGPGDGPWALESVSCLGACGQAPVLVVDGELEPRLPVDEPRELERRLAAVALGIPPAPGGQDR
jgi:bidirectional [NiFe] hydrogenase diaphorase subunit